MSQDTLNPDQFDLPKKGHVVRIPPTGGRRTKTALTMRLDADAALGKSGSHVHLSGYPAKKDESGWFSHGRWRAEYVAKETVQRIDPAVSHE